MYTWYIFIIQKVQNTVIHLEVDEEQWKVTQGPQWEGCVAFLLL